MSDSEIELVIEHKVRQARLEGQNSEVCQTVTSQMQAIRNMTSDMYDISAATLGALLGRNPNSMIGVISDEQARG